MKRYLWTLAFGAGAGALGLELTAARWLEPWFGNSQLVWATLISLVLAFLAGGAWLGGRWGDRSPRLDRLLWTVGAAGLLASLIPVAGPRALQATVQDLLAFESGLLAAAAGIIVLLLGLPIVLLGSVTTWALRIALGSVQSGGQTAGRLYAAATLGSIAGTLAPVLWLIPAFGTRWTFFLLALFLLLLVTIGARWAAGACLRIAVSGALGMILVLSLAFLTDTRTIRGVGTAMSAGTVVYEDESRFNYIAVLQEGPELFLKLNEGVGIHSVHHPRSVLSLGVWDYFLLAPWFSADPPDPATAEVLVIGLAAGTVSSLWTAIYGPAPITGIELDPQILEVGRAYFGLHQPNVTAIAADGRRWLRSQPASRAWDVIAIDAYRVPYIPFHLATQEFFVLVRTHLTEAGVIAINVGRTRADQSLVNSLVATMAQIFPQVMVLNEPVPAGTIGNALVVGLATPSGLDQYRRHVQNLPARYPAEFRAFAQRSLEQVSYGTPVPGTMPLTDDKAPIERIVHGMVWSFLRGTEPDA